jgi:signal peptidase II
MSAKAGWIVFAALLAADRAAKLWAEASLASASGNAVIPSLSLYRNEGIAFSLMKNFPHAGLAAAILGMGALAFICARAAPARKSLGVVFLWAGALGNFTDRLLYGRVIDWIYVGTHINLADLWLVIGCLVVLAEMIRAGKPRFF